MLEFLVDPLGACEVLEVLSNLPRLRRKPAKIRILLGLAQIYGSTSESDSLARVLTRAERLISKIGHKTGSSEIRMLRFRYDDDEPKDDGIIRRTNQLLDIARTFRDIDYPGREMKVLELAAELHCQLPATSNNEALGIRIHDELQRLTEKNGDNLSSILIQLRRCDLLSYFGSQWAPALELRGRLLELPWSVQNPYFGRFHREQIAESLNLNMDTRALRHAEKYLQYCERFRDEESQSEAQCLHFHSLFMIRRMSEEKRIIHLENIRSKLEKAIQTDGAAGFLFAQVQNLMLLVELVEELGELEEEEEGEKWQAVFETLDRAQKICEHIPKKGRGIVVWCEVNCKKIAAIVKMETLGLLPNTSTTENLLTTQIEQPISLPAGKWRVLNHAELLRQLSVADIKRSYPLSRKILTTIRGELEWVEKEGHILERLFCYIFLSVFTYILALREEEAAQSTWHDAGFESQKEGLEMALDHAEKAFEIQQLLSKKLTGDTMFEYLASKQAYFTDTIAIGQLDLIMSICHELDNPVFTWRWSQRRKAYGLSEAILSSSPSNTHDQVSPGDLRSDVTFEDLLWASTASATKITFVDWTPTGSSLEPFLLLVIQFEKDEEGCQVRRWRQASLTITTQKILDWKEEYLNTRRLQDDNAETFFENIEALVEPLEGFTAENELLVLCPTAPFHNIPLHALRVGGKLLLERNPIVYIPTFSVLIQCLRYLEAPEPDTKQSSMWKATVMGAYEDSAKDSDTVVEREEIYDCLRTLAQDLDTETILGPQLRTADFKREATDAKLIHFHGHGSFDQHDISKQSLILGTPGSVGGKQVLSVSDILELKLKAPHVTLIACEAGIQDFSLEGDEPLGILTAFIVAGATSVIGALWTIKSENGRKFTEGFYNNFLHEQPFEENYSVVNLAVALQRAALEIRNCKKTRAPYHWAAFVLHGAWFCERKPRT